MRKLLFLFWLATPLASAAPYPFAWGCMPFEPSEAQLTEIVESASTQMSPDLEFQQACFTEESIITGIAEVEQVRTNHYWFFWPTDKAYRGLEIFQDVRCKQAPAGAINCIKVATATRSSHGELIYLDGVESVVELYDLLEFRDRFLGKEYSLVEIVQDLVLRQDPTKVDMRTYRLIGHSKEDEQISYEVERRCNAINECTWAISEPGQWRY